MLRALLSEEFFFNYNYMNGLMSQRWQLTTKAERCISVCATLCLVAARRDAKLAIHYRCKAPRSTSKSQQDSARGSDLRRQGCEILAPFCQLACPTVETGSSTR